MLKSIESSKRIGPFDDNAFPIMNLSTSIKEVSELHKNDSVRGILAHAERLQSAIGDVSVYSDGSIRKGHDPDLITREAKFNVSDKNPIWRMYWGDGENIVNSYPFFVNNEVVFLGRKNFMKASLDASYSSSFSRYRTPVFNLEGLYKHHKIDLTGLSRFTARNPSNLISRKIKFLEEFLDKEDSFGYTPGDMLVKNPKLRLKLLEGNYLRNADFYARKFSF